MEWTEALVRLAIATGVCVLVGFEREFSGQPAGMRTHAVVGIGAALFTIAGAYGFGDIGRVGDPGRISAQVASGIGFLGAGVIIRHGLAVRGLTTAATVWLAGALGVAAGAGMGVAVVITTALVLAVLLSAHLTRSLAERRHRKVLRVRYVVGGGALGEIVQALEASARYVGRIRIVDETETDPIVRTVWLETEIDAAQLDAVSARLHGRSDIFEIALDPDTPLADD